MKFALSSKTFWLNLLVLVTAVFALPEFTALVGDGALQYIVAAQAAINIVLRFFGGAPLTANPISTGDSK